MLKKRGHPVGLEVIGHRGAADIFPENTLASFQYAVDIGCDTIELDVHLSRDEHVVVMHDESVVRTTNGIGTVAQWDLADLKKLDAGRGERIPTLSEVFDLVRNRSLLVQIELKGSDTEIKVPRLVAEQGMKERVRFTSFFHQRVLVARKELPYVQTGVLVSCNPVEPAALLKASEADSLHVKHERITPDLVEKIHMVRKRVVAWGKIVDIPTMERLIGLGVDAICSDRPDLLIQCLQRTTRVP